MWVALLLLALGVGIYANSLGNGFVIDDMTVIGANERVQQCRWWELLTGEYWPNPRGNKLYRPLTMLSFAANWALSHQVWTLRLPNVMLHVGVTYLLFLLIQTWTRSFPAAFVAALWFLIHPIHTAPLNAIVDRADLGAAFFGLMAVLLWYRDDEVSSRRAWAGPFLAAISFVTAAMFKENALTLALVVVLLEFTPRPSPGIAGSASRWKRRIARCYLPLLFAIGACLAARLTVLGVLATPPENIPLIDNAVAHPDHGLAPDDSRFLARWGTPLAVFGKAAGLMLWPHPLCWDYSYASIPVVKRWSDRRLATGAACLLAAGLAMVVSYRRKKLVFIALGFSLLTYSMVSNVPIVIASLFAERYLYLPSAGVCMLVGILAARALQSSRGSARFGYRLGAGCLLFLLVVSAAWYAWVTVDRNRDWRSNHTLSAADLQTNPRSSRLWCAVAMDALDAMQLGDAASHAERAIGICPEYAEPWKIAGLAYWRSGEFDRARTCLDQFFERGGCDDEGAVITAADISKAQGDCRRALALLEGLISRNPRAATARNNLAWYLLSEEAAELRDPEAALRHAKTAISLVQGQGSFIDTYVAALLAMNRRHDAIQELRRLLPTVPPTDQYRPELAKKLAELRQEKGDN